jgi:hypothetical protein
MWVDSAEDYSFLKDDSRGDATVTLVGPNRWRWEASYNQTSPTARVDFNRGGDWGMAADREAAKRYAEEYLGPIEEEP